MLTRKILSLTGWSPKFPLEIGIRQTLEWYGLPENLTKFKSEIYNV